MAASFPTSVKSFTTKVDGTDTIAAAHVNDLQNEVTAIETDLLTTTATTYTPTWAGGTGTAIGNGTLSGRYRQRGKLVWFEIHMTAGSTTNFGDGTTWTFSLPITAADTNAGTMPARLQNTGTAFFLGVAVPVSTTTISIYCNNLVAGASSTVPFTWASTDTLRISGWYLAA